jgi:hypothetical protein
MASPAKLHPNDPADCIVCKRHAIGLGVGNPGGSPRWICADCVPLAREIRNVKYFDPYENIAIVDAGEKAGEYLDGLAGGAGKSDLADLTTEEWIKFLRFVVVAFGDSMRTQIAENRAPF